MSDRHPRVSVIVTSYNYGRFIGETIESVLAQTEGSFELIIVDDCSVDNSWEVIQRYRDSRIQAHRFEVNRGACSAYNAAYRLARGEFIASLDSDDVFEANKLAEQLKFFSENPEIDICGSYISEINDVGHRVPDSERLYAPWFNRDVDLNDPASWIWENHLCHSSALVRKSLHDKMGLFRTDLTYTPDWNFWIRSLVAGARFGILPQELLRYRSHDKNITHSNADAVMWEYADFSGGVLHPFLNSIDRPELIHKNIRIFFKRFFELDGNWSRFLDLVAKLQPLPGHVDDFRISPPVFDDRDLAAFVTRLSEVRISELQERSPANEGQRVAASKVGETEIELRNKITLLEANEAALQDIAQSCIRKLDEARDELAQTVVSLQQSESNEKKLATDADVLRSELIRLKGTIWGKAENFFSRRSR